jgi:hypothetical protein
VTDENDSGVFSLLEVSDEKDLAIWVMDGGWEVGGIRGLVLEPGVRLGR